MTVFKVKGIVYNDATTENFHKSAVPLSSMKLFSII